MISDMPPTVSSQTAIAAALCNVAKATENVGKNIGDVATSIDSLSTTIFTTISDGISSIVNESQAARLSNEYYTLLNQLVTFKDNHPEMKLEMSDKDISDSTFQLSDKMSITLKYLFTKYPELFELFKTKCENGICKPEDWFYSFCTKSGIKVSNRRSGFNDYIDFFKLETEEHCVQFSKEDMIEFFSEEVDKMIYLHYYNNVEKIDCTEEIYKKIVDGIACRYQTPDDFYSILEGSQKLNAWLSEENTKRLIQLLRNVYSKAVFQYLNS